MPRKKRVQEDFNMGRCEKCGGNFMPMVLDGRNLRVCYCEISTLN